MLRPFAPEKGRESHSYEERVRLGQITCNARIAVKITALGNKRTKRCPNTAEFVDARKCAAYCWEHRSRAAR